MQRMKVYNLFIFFRNRNMDENLQFMSNAIILKYIVPFSNSGNYS